MLIDSLPPASFKPQPGWAKFVVSVPPQVVDQLPADVPRPAEKKTRGVTSRRFNPRRDARAKAARPAYLYVDLRELPHRSFYDDVYNSNVRKLADVGPDRYDAKPKPESVPSVVSTRKAALDVLASRAREALYSQK